MCKRWPSLPLAALLWLAPLAAPLAGPPAAPLPGPPAAPLAEPPAAPPQRACAQLAARYAARYRPAVGGGGLRAVRRGGRPAELLVWGGAGPAGAAAALLHAALRHGLGYDAALRRRAFDMCTADYSRLSVAPALAFERCPAAQYRALTARLAADSAARVPLGGPLLARAPGACARPDGALPAYDDAALACASALTLLRFERSKSRSPDCAFSVRPCRGEDRPERPGRAAHVVLLAGTAPAPHVDKLHRYVCLKRIPLAFLFFDDASCFRETVRSLKEANSSFLFFDTDLDMYEPGLLPVALREDGAGGAGASCPARHLNDLTDLVHKLGDGPDVRAAAPRVADVVAKFCPSLEHLQQVLRARAADDDVEGVACEWALRNTATFESWLATEKYRYGLYCYLCVGDPLNEEYRKVIRVANEAVGDRDDFDVAVHVIDDVQCGDDQSMERNFIEMMNASPKYVMGVVAWSSSEGAARVARRAGRQRVPLALAGPVAGAAGAALAVDGGLDDLAACYRAFFGSCDWTRLAILSDGSTYARAFAESLTRGREFVYVDAKIASETSTDVLKSLRAAEARVFVVNTNSSMAVEIINSAARMGMTPPKYAWVVRDWSPAANGAAAARRGRMEHFSLSAAWRGPAGGAAGGAAGDAGLRARLRDLWPDSAWPALAAPLADAILALRYGFAVFHGLYSTNSYSMMRNGIDAPDPSDVYDRLRVPGAGRELSFRKGAVENVTVYVERWRGAARSQLAAWRAGECARVAPRAGLCAPRVADRPPCSFPAAGAAFARRCYDLPLYAALGALALLPVALAAARRARLRRLAVRDLRLLARMLPGERPALVVRGDSLSVHRRIGAGNFGSVYLATLRRSKEEEILVAAKEPRDESDEREHLREAAILQRLDHENVVKFLGVCLTEGSLLILMEYALHGDLLQYLRARRRARPPEREAAHAGPGALTRLAREAAAALGYLARRGVLHRDVRAANCLLDARRTLKLADFGLARTLRDRPEYTSVRRTVLPVLWMAPESLRGTFSSASDVWSLGVLMLELMTLGDRPYGECPPALVMAHVLQGGRPPLPPDATPQAASLVAACWRRGAAERASAAELERYLTRRPYALRPTRLPAPALALRSRPPRHSCGSCLASDAELRL